MKATATILTAFLLLVSICVADEGTIHVSVDGRKLVGYQAKPLRNPAGGEKFKGSNFVHPLKTPSGFTMSAANPKTHHHHHFGLWWPWKYVVVEGGRKVLCWELQKGDGLIEAKEGKLTEDGFTAKSVYIDRKAPGGPKTLIHETVHAKVSGLVKEPASGYWLDLEIIHEVAGDKPLEILKYRYSGFSIRATEKWAGHKATVLTSEGILDEVKDPKQAKGKKTDRTNFTRAKWVRIEGPGDKGPVGMVMMSHTTNHDHPEKLRTWGSREIFVNFNTVQDKSWTFEPGKKYTRKYRVFVYDGTVTAKQAEALWKQYTTP